MARIFKDRRNRRVRIHCEDSEWLAPVDQRKYRATDRCRGCFRSNQQAQSDDSAARRAGVSAPVELFQVQGKSCGDFVAMEAAAWGAAAYSRSESLAFVQHTHPGDRLRLSAGRQQLGVREGGVGLE